jgi:hypothetical protein
MSRIRKHAVTGRLAHLPGKLEAFIFILMVHLTMNAAGISVLNSVMKLRAFVPCLKHSTTVGTQCCWHLVTLVAEG